MMPPSERLRLRNEELEQQHRGLREAVRLHGQLMAKLSHDLRTPLNAIVGFAEMMHDGKVGRVSSDQMEFLGDILTGCDQILRLLDDVPHPAEVEDETRRGATTPLGPGGKGIAPAGEPILVVDDNAASRKLVLMLFSREGYDVRTAADAEEALAVLSHFAPRLILMDLQMPGIDGFELTRRLRADPGMAGVLILALSAYATKGDEERARLAGCDGYVSKPIDTRTLPARIAGLLARTSRDESP
jgi:two-component system, cell cycle response regulator DivK